MPVKPVGSDRLGERREDKVNVNFPFLMEIEHPTLDIMRMFQLTEVFDLYEMQKDPSKEHDRVKDIFLVDVLEIEPKRTLMKITPAEPLPYRDLAKHVALMLKIIGKQHLKDQIKPVKLSWEISKTGVSSDLRGMLRSVQ